MRLIPNILLALSFFMVGGNVQANEHITTVADYAHIIDFDSNRVLL